MSFKRKKHTPIYILHTCIHLFVYYRHASCSVSLKALPGTDKGLNVSFLGYAYAS